MENIYTISTANVYDKTTIVPALFWGIKEHTQIAIDSGYDGIDYWPTNPLTLPLRRSLHAPDNERWKRYVVSGHQSFRSFDVNKMVVKTSQQGNSLLSEFARSLGLFLLLPSPDNSVRKLAELRKCKEKIGLSVTNFHINLYPDLFDLPTELQSIPNKVVQTYPDVCNSWKVRNTEGFIALSTIRKYGLVLSTYHLRRPDRTGRRSFLNDWGVSIPKLIRSGRVKQLHLEVMRSDLPQSNFNTYQEGLDLLDQDLEITDIKKILRLIAEEGWRGQVVVEALTGGIKQAINPGGGRLTVDNQIEFYSRVRDSLEVIFK